MTVVGRGPSDHINIRILHPGSKAQDKGASRTMDCRMMWSVGPRDRDRKREAPKASPRNKNAQGRQSPLKWPPRLAAASVLDLHRRPTIS